MSAGPRLLPPPALRRDWVLAGLCAGGALGVAEATLILVDRGADAPPELRLLLTSASVVLVASLVCALGLWLGAKRRPYSVLAGGVVGPLLAAPVVGGAAGFIAQDAFGIDIGLRLGVGLLLAIVAGALAVRLTTRLERQAGIALSPLPPALGLAFAVAVAEWAFSARPSIDPTVALVLAALGLACLCGVGSQAVLRRGRPASLGGVALGLFLALPLLAWGGRIWPWMLIELDGERGVERSNLLTVIVASPAGAEPVLASRELLARGAVPLEGLATQGGGGFGSLLELSDGTPLFRRLAERGYRTAAYVAEPIHSDALGAETLIVHAPGEAWTSSEVPWVAGGGIVVAVSRWRASDLGPFLVRAMASPARTSAEASAWLARWSASRAAAPFALLVAYAPEPRPPDVERASREVDRWVDRLEKLALLDATCVAVVSIGPSGGAFDALLWDPAAHSKRPSDARAGPRGLAEILLEACAESARIE